MALRCAELLPVFDSLQGVAPADLQQPDALHGTNFVTPILRCVQPSALTLTCWSAACVQHAMHVHGHWTFLLGIGNYGDGRFNPGLASVLPPASLRPLVGSNLLAPLFLS